MYLSERKYTTEIRRGPEEGICRERPHILHRYGASPGFGPCARVCGGLPQCLVLCWWGGCYWGYWGSLVGLLVSRKKELRNRLRRNHEGNFISLREKQCRVGENPSSHQEERWRERHAFKVNVVEIDRLLRKGKAFPENGSGW